MIRTVKTKFGILEGVLSNAGFALFRGVPYAKPPVGELRWKAPQDQEAWEGVKVCDTFGPACCQFDRWSVATGDVDDDPHGYVHMPNYPYPPRMSEDCLYLNIYTPAESPEDKLPVMFYIHGGGCQAWYGSDYEYCGDGLCRKGCIVVSISYRLNVFGFMVHPELAAESGHNASGNYGVMDQIKALQWVYENIAGFGGDPENITVFGQSAGGRSTMALLCSPLSEKYVNRVSVQSGGGVGRLMREGSREELEAQGLAYMKEMGCKNLAEMRALPWEKVRDVDCKLGGFAHGFNIYTDGYVLPEPMDVHLVSGRVKDVDMVIGCTVDEGVNDKPTAFDFNMFASAKALAEVQLKNGKKPVYFYVFDREQPGDDAGVPHSCDNRYQFGSLDGCWRPYTGEDWALSEKMQRYWANFAAVGEPGGEGVEIWTPYTAESTKQMHLKIGNCEMVDFDALTGGKNTEEVKSMLALEK